MTHKVLNNGVSIPAIGFGTCKLGNDEEIHHKLLSAIRCGYRHFDTASAYGNLEAIGKTLEYAMNNSVKREDIFITCKISNEELSGVDDGYATTKNAFENCLEKLKLDYLDLYLIHWPVPRYMENKWRQLNIDTWRAMEELYGSGKIRAIGLSNFAERHIENILENTSVVPMVNQIEIQPTYQQRELIKYCKAKNICVEGWSPLKKGEVLHDPTLQELAKKYGRPVSQLCLRFCVQLGAVPIVKSSNEKRMIENMDIFDWAISEEDMQTIYSLDTPDGYFKNYAYPRRDSC